ncbi:MAG: dimethylarginine dimethylaminohydrolase family protein [Candidatus Thorarchaeota archaeon]
MVAVDLKRKLKYALVREPGLSFSKCITSHPLQHTINVSNAKKQHSAYCNTLTELGLEVIQLPIDNERSDSCFVEDNAIIHNNKALITRMGAEVRRGEEVAVETALSDFMKTKKTIPPGTIEGGDVIHFPEHIICGVTKRTNLDGVDQMKNWLDVTVETVRDPNIVHLKSYVTFLGDDFIIATKKYINHPSLKNFRILIVDESESYAANTLTIENTILIPKGFPRTLKLLNETDYDVIPLDMREFQKCEGALTCLSLLF